MRRGARLETVQAPPIGSPSCTPPAAGRTAPRSTTNPGPEQTTLHLLVQQHAASFIAHTEANTGADAPRFVKVEFDAFLECGILAHR